MKHKEEIDKLERAIESLSIGSPVSKFISARLKNAVAQHDMGIIDEDVLCIVLESISDDIKKIVRSEEQMLDEISGSYKTYWLVTIQSPTINTTVVLEAKGPFFKASQLMEVYGEAFTIVFAMQITREQHETFHA